MDEEYYEERVLSIVRGREGWADRYSSISEFKQHLKEAALTQEELRLGWVLYEQQLELDNHSNFQHKIVTLLKHLASHWWDWHLNYYLVQFWAVVKVEGRRHYLSTSHHPFCAGLFLNKGVCWYRKLCMDHVYSVDMEGAVEKNLGGVGRAYRNKQPESTPDLRLYSTDEFPLRDYAARCGLKSYLTLPLFDFHQNQCYGVLELSSHHPIMQTYLFSTLDKGLQFAGLRSTHINFIPISSDTNNMPNKYKQQPESEIREILELTIKAVPRLDLAQVWVPCKQCANMSTSVCCMERSSFINARSKIVNSCFDIDDDMFDYLQACEYHNLQIDLISSVRQELYDLSISKNPLAHYAWCARLSLHFEICLQSVNNSDHFYIIEFFLQPECREDACGDSSLNLLLRIMEMKLKSFKFVLGGQLQAELVVQSRQSNPIECEEIEMLKVMNSCKEIFSEYNFTNYLEMVDLCCLRPSSEVSDEGWVFCRPAGEGLYENDNSLLVPRILIKEKIEHFMKEIAAEFGTGYHIVQFWAPKMVEDRYCLETSDQPYALGYLAKGLASFRKKCMQHHYFVDEESKEEEFGPPGRVFRNGLPEVITDLTFYSTKEFSIRNYAVHCCFAEYFVLPVFDEPKQFNKHNCVGVLEFIGFSYIKYCGDIRRALETAKLRSIHIDHSPRLLSNNYNRINIKNCKIEAMTELRDATLWFTKIPQCYMVNVWVSNGKCIDRKSRCMKQELFTKCPPVGGRIHVEPRVGMIGMVLESESKSCFCRNICEFSITDQPLEHHERTERCNACFAICLQSSHTGDLLYVVEFFLYQGPATYEYLCCFLNFLLPMMKKLLKTFKIATGKQLGEELVVEVIEFSEANQLTSSKSDQLGVFPIKFKSVQYPKEHQYIEDQQVQPSPNLKKTEKGKRKTSPPLSLEDLKQHFGKKLEDVAQELGVGRSTIKRACRDYGINRWPRNEKQARNPSLFERESARETSVHQNVPHTNMESTQHVIAQEEAEKVTIRVKYEEDIIKFELYLSLGVSKLFEEVVRRLNLKMGSFKLKYVDEDNEEILIACDDDLQLCPKSQTATGKTCIQLFVQLNSK